MQTNCCRRARARFDPIGCWITLVLHLKCTGPHVMMTAEFIMVLIVAVQSTLIHSYAIYTRFARAEIHSVVSVATRH